MAVEHEPLVPPGLGSELIETYRTLGESFHGLHGLPMPSLGEIKRVLDDVRELVFPGIGAGLRPKGVELRGYVEAILHGVALRMRQQVCFGEQYVKHAAKGDLNPALGCPECETHADQITRGFLQQLPALRVAMTKDAQAAMSGDPAARDMSEIILSYPGFYAIGIARIAHALFQLGAQVVPRMMTEYAHQATGIDIHPGATLGESFFIDHGTGVVIGETTVIGDRVRLYQGVTLGALSLPSKRVSELRAGPQRHPTIEDDVIIYAGATILGGNTVIGKGAVIGGNCWIIESVPPCARVSVQVTPDIRTPEAKV